MKLFFNLIQNNFHFIIQLTYASFNALSAVRVFYRLKTWSVAKTTIVNLS